MTILLTAEQEEFVQTRLATGVYQGVGEILDEAFRSLRSSGDVAEEAQAKIRRGLDQADRGEFSLKSVPDIIAECNQRWDSGTR